MEVSVSSRNMDVPEKLRQLTEDKVGRLGRYVEGMEYGEVRFVEARNPRIVDSHSCEVTLEGHGHHVRSKVAATDSYVALDRAVEKLEQQLHKLKTKLVRRQHGAGRGTAVPVPAGDVVELPAAEEDVSAPTEPRIVKSKRFAMMPMTPEDAVQRMDLLGHGFFFFTNIDTSAAAVVYKRDDGDIGLIDEAD